MELAADTKMELTASSKPASSFINMAGTLLVVAMLSSLLLGLVDMITKDRIRMVQEEKKVKAIRSVVMPGFTNDPAKDRMLVDTPTGEKLEVYPAKKNDEIISYAVKTTSGNGFSGEIALMVGFLPDGSIYKISVLFQRETPGLGTKIELPAFQRQFEGKNINAFRLGVKKDGGDVDSITGATITTRAFCEAVQKGYEGIPKK
jgi:electron transport complex protein RnfG